MACLRVIATGGTIAYKWDPSQGGAVPALSGQQLIQAVPQLGEIAQVKVHQFSNVASPMLGPEDFLRLSRECHRALSNEGADGIVITMGTATLAECAYMLDLLLQEEGPVIVTGAMRTHSHPSPDGPGNLLDSGITAASQEARGWGVLVCMNGELHDPRDVSKTHSVDLATFRSWEYGPVGAVRNDRVVMYRRPLIKEHIPVQALNARVEIVMAVEGDDGRLLDAAAEFADGIVVMGFAPGGVPPGMVPAIQRALDRGRVLVLVTRSYGGPLGMGVYVTSEGGVDRLVERGVLPGGSLRAPKARIKLMLALSTTRDPNQLRSMFTNV